MFFSGDPSARKRMDLGGRSSNERDRKVLLDQTRGERRRRQDLRLQNSSAVKIQGEPLSCLTFVRAQKEHRSPSYHLSYIHQNKWWHFALTKALGGRVPPSLVGEAVTRRVERFSDHRRSIPCSPLLLERDNAGGSWAEHLATDIIAVSTSLLDVLPAITSPTERAADDDDMPMYIDVKNGIDADLERQITSAIDSKLL